MTELINTYRGTVYPWHCDHMGHMNVMWYAGKFDEATWNLLSISGITAAYLKLQNRGMVAGKQETSYKQELLAGMIVIVNSKIIEINDKSIRFIHEMRNGETNQLCAITEFTGIHIDYTLRKACSIPDYIKVKLEQFIL